LSGSGWEIVLENQGLHLLVIAKRKDLVIVIAQAASRAENGFSRCNDFASREKNKYARRAEVKILT
jgi:hypothetical protein